MTQRRRTITAGVLALALCGWTPAIVAPEARAEAPAGQMTWAVALHAGADLFEPAETPGLDHAVHVPLRAARRAGEADARQRHGAEPGRVVERCRTDGLVYEFVLRQGREVPQRRARHRRRREVLVRALPGHRRRRR